jgi:hypothetical protein
MIGVGIDSLRSVESHLCGGSGAIGRHEIDFCPKAFISGGDPHVFQSAPDGCVKLSSERIAYHELPSMIGVNVNRVLVDNEAPGLAIVRRRCSDSFVENAKNQFIHRTTSGGWKASRLGFFTLERDFSTPVIFMIR